MDEGDRPGMEQRQWGHGTESYDSGCVAEGAGCMEGGWNMLKQHWRQSPDCIHVTFMCHWVA